MGSGLGLGLARATGLVGEGGRGMPCMPARLMLDPLREFARSSGADGADGEARPG